jgi:3-dehydroquinate dehydratase
MTIQVVQVRQTDDEGELLRWVHAASNAADPVVVEREEFRHHSYVSAVQRIALRGVR